MPQTTAALPHMDAIYTAVNFIPVLTLCCVVYAAGAFMQRSRDSEKRLSQLTRKVDRIHHAMTRRGMRIDDDDDGEKE